MIKCRNILIVVVLLIGQLVIVSANGLAQDSPEIPKVLIAITDEGTTVTPAEVNAGITNLVFENTREEGAFEALIARLKEGATPDELMSVIGQSDDPLAPFQFLQLYGGVPLAPGNTTTITVDLKAGMHLLMDRTSGPTTFMVMESDGEGAEPPEADVSLALVDFAFGIPSQLEAGEQVWHIYNAGQQFHEAVIIKIDEDTSLEEASALVSTVLTPDGRMAEDSPAEFVFIWPPIDPDENVWVTLNLEPGTYALGCLLPDMFSLPEEMHLHLDHGMVRIFAVE